MLWKFALVAALAVGAFGEIPTVPQEVEDYVKSGVARLCEKYNATDKTTAAQTAVVNFRSCLEGLIDVETFQKEIEEAKPHGNMDVVFKKYCGKTAELKSCINAVSKGVEPCLPVPHFDMNIVSNVTGTLLDFVCYKDGDRIALFIAEGGPQCIESKKTEIGACAADTRKESSSESGLMSLSQEQRCDLADRLIACVVTALESCDSSTPSNMVESLFKYMRKFTPCHK